MRVPLIISGPMVQAKDEITHAFASTDIAATMVGSGRALPKRALRRPAYPAHDGENLLPLLADPKRGYTRRMNSLAMNLRKPGAVQRRLQAPSKPAPSGRWAVAPLQHCHRPATNDLAELEPERFRTMLADYVRFTEQNNVPRYLKP